MNLLNNRSLLNSGLSLIVMIASLCGCTELKQSPEINNQSIKSTKALNEADVRYNLALSDFEKSLNEAFSIHESNIQVASKDTAGELASLDSCLKIVSFMAWDKVRGKNKTETYLQEKITPSLELANKALPQALDKAISTFEDKKNKNTEQLKSDISSILMQPVQDSFNSNSNLSSKIETDKVLDKFGTGTYTTTRDWVKGRVSIPDFEMSKSAQKQMVKLVNKIFYKQIAKVIVATSSVTVPLGVSQILAIVSTSSAMYDLYHLRQDFKSELNTLIVQSEFEHVQSLKNDLNIYKANSLLKYKEFQSNLSSNNNVN